MKHCVILLATDGSTVEAMVRALGADEDCEFQCVKTCREAVSKVMDGSSDENLAIVDLDWRGGGRSLVHTAGGALPVIAIVSKPKRWLFSMQRHRRIGATLTKPVSPVKLKDAFQRLRRESFIGARREV